MSDGGETVDTEPMMPGQRPVDRPAVMPQPGELFADRYRIDRLLGKGGMGEVYLAMQSQLERPVAVKILKPPERIEDDPKFDERFLREAAAAAKLHHANTITVHDFGQTRNGQLYIVMEYLEGRDLQSSLRRKGTLGPERAIHVAVQICKSLREAHGKGMVHRDLKPANVVLVERDGDPDFVKVLDFGLVKYRDEETELTLAGKFVGSPKYTSPEALDRNKKVDHRADIYSLGILLYTMLAGQPPFTGDPIQILTAHLREEPPAMAAVNPMARTTPRLEKIVARCLLKDPEARFQTMADLLEALLSADGTLENADPTTTMVLNDPPSKDRTQRGSSGVMLTLLMLSFLAVAVGVGLLIFSDSKSPAGGDSEPSADGQNPSAGDGVAPDGGSASPAEEGADESSEPSDGVTPEAPTSASEDDAGAPTEPTPDGAKQAPPGKTKGGSDAGRRGKSKSKDESLPPGYKANPY